MKRNLSSLFFVIFLSVPCFAQSDITIDTALVQKLVINGGATDKKFLKLLKEKISIVV